MTGFFSKEESGFYVKKKVVLPRGMPSFQENLCFREARFLRNDILLRKARIPLEK